MGKTRSGTNARRRRGVALVAVCAPLTVLGVGCESHVATPTQPCPAPPVVKAVVASERGAIAIARIGLTPRTLKAEQKKC